MRMISVLPQAASYLLAGCGKTHFDLCSRRRYQVWDDAEPPCRMRKKAVRQGRSEQRGESYSVPYVEPLSDARTPLADFFRILLDAVG
jgi:hypothetical protein